jgi:hypothetical protein
MLTIGGDVWVTAEDGTRVPVPVGEYPLESDMILVVSEEGIVGELVEKPTEEEVVEDAPAEMAEPQEGGKVNNDAKIASEIESAIKSILIKYTEQAQVITKLQEQVTELSKAPASKPIRTQPTQLKNEGKTSKERLLNTIKQLQ